MQDNSSLPPPRSAAAVILAGGQSRRMRHDKALLPLGGEPLIGIVLRQLRPLFDPVLVSASKPGKYDFLGCPVIIDEAPGQGPLSAILSALRVSPRELNFVVACDIPVIDAAFVARMLAEAGEGHIVVPRYADGKMEPLFAFYQRSAIPAIERLLAAGIRKLVVLYEHCPTRFLPADGLEWLQNINTTSDYRHMIASLCGKNLR